MLWYAYAGNNPLTLVDPTGMYTDYSKMMEGADNSTFESAQYTDEDLAETKMLGLLAAYNDIVGQSTSAIPGVLQDIENGIQGAFNFDFGADQATIGARYASEGEYLRGWFHYVGGVLEAGLDLFLLGVMLVPDLLDDANPNSIQALLSGGQGPSLGNLPLAAERGISVLGKYPDYINLSNDLGARRFSVPTDVWNKMTPTQQWAANQRFLDRMIARGDNIILSNPVRDINSVTGAFRRELDYMIGQGFRISPNGTQLIR